MSNDDHAVVVGVAKYPELEPLSGPENDAVAFDAWLQAADGGQVPQGNITRILSSDPWPPPPALPEPTVQRVQTAFQDLIDRSLNNGGRGGRRLYIYLAGHGFEPILESTRKEVALLMANAAPKRTGHHIAGRIYAEWFLNASFFDEIVLFMDCCRERYPRAFVQRLPWDDLAGQKPAKFLYAYATQSTQASREGPDPQSKEVRGLFTLALLAGLREAQRDGKGRLKTSALEAFVYNYMQQLAPKVIGGQIEQEPEFDYRKNREIVFDPVGNIPAAQVWKVQAKLTPANAGKAVVLADGKGQPIAPVKSGPKIWAWESLGAGLYRFRLDGQDGPFFELLGEGGVRNEVL
jgi:uncharacterized caspase-like protein